TLQFVRYVALVAKLGARVILEVQPALKSLLAGMDGLAVIVAKGESLPPFDLHAPLMSLPLAFDTELASIPAEIPYIHVPRRLEAAWRERLGEARAPRIGFVWAGSADHKNNRRRSIALGQFASLLSVPNVDFVSLQKDLSVADATMLGAHA